MIFERIEVAGLSHYSYILGCPADGRMVVVDPKRDVQDYVDFARKRKLTISHVLETHIHADYASGARELAELTGATVWASRYDEGETFQVSFPHTDVSDGDRLTIGSVRITALHTPGHTPEHLSYLVYDTNRSADTPMAMLSGDFLFIGSLGRPDLLGEDAKRDLAAKLYQSVRNLDSLPDGLEIHPAHGAGSLCGAGMSGRPTSTLGYERAANAYLDPALTEQAFIDRILGASPPFPEYYKRMKRVNAEGAPPLGQRTIAPIAPDDAAQRIDDGRVVVIDLRDQRSFAAAHIAGSFGIGAGDSLPVWASWVVPYDTPILLIARDQHEADDAARSLSRVGHDSVTGFLEGGIDQWKQRGLPLESYADITPAKLHEALEAGQPIQVVDVRSDGEWQAGHIEGALHLFGGEIEKNLAQLPDKNAPLAMVCGGGYRSTVIASVLRRHGYTNIINVVGGMGAWRKEKLPVTSADRTPQVTS